MAEVRVDQRAPALAADAFLRTDHIERDLAGHTFRGAVATTVSQVLRFAISLVGTMVLARLLTPRDYGLIGMVGAVTSFVAIFKDLGLDAALIQRAHVTAEQISTLFWINTVTGVVLMMVTVGIAPAVTWFYGEPSLTWITAMSAFAFLLGGLGIQHEALLRRQMRFARLASIDVGSMTVGYVVGIFLAWHHMSYRALVLSQLSMGLARTLGLWVALDWRPQLKIALAGVRSMLVFGGNLTGFAFVNYFARNLDNVLIGRYWGPYQLGLYSRAYQLLLLPIDQINSPITQVAVPALSRLANTPDRYRLGYLRILEKIAMLTMPLMALLVVTSDWVVEVVLGPQWRGVGPIFALLGLVGVAQPVASTTGWLFVSQGRGREMFRWGLIGCTLTVAAIVVGLPWGAIGVAAAYSIASLLVVIPLSLWFVARRGPVQMRDFYRTATPAAAATVCVMATLLILRVAVPVATALVNLMAAAIIGGAVALLVLCSFRRGRAAIRDVAQYSLRLLAKGSPAGT